MTGWSPNCRDIHGSILPSPMLQQLLKYVTCRCEKVISKDNRDIHGLQSSLSETSFLGLVRRNVLEKIKEFPSHIWK
jgi:hypothetical protein